MCVGLSPPELSFPTHISPPERTLATPKHWRQTCQRDYFNAFLWLCYSPLQKTPTALGSLQNENQVPWSAMDIVLLFSTHRISKLNSTGLNSAVIVDSPKLSPMSCVTMRRFLKFYELFSFHFEQHLPLINVRSCVVFSWGFYFFQTCLSYVSKCTSVSQNSAVNLCLSAYVPGSLSYSHAPCSMFGKNILFSMKKTLGMQGRAPSQAQLRLSCSHTQHFLHPQSNGRSRKPMLIKAGSLASPITCLCPYMQVCDALN